ncbi:MAG TPA: hypothetical protein VHB93_00545 [Candidatus Paceibacterota bacterium]|nr:hypothetical protein [Candidatus Paceibacterota bacterium]
MLAKNRGIIIGLGAIVLLAVAYLVFFSGSPSADLTSGAPTSPDEMYFVNLSGELSDISFDTTVLQDPRFMALTDIRTAVLPEQTGRPDPFAPISGVSTAK